MLRGPATDRFRRSRKLTVAMLNGGFVPHQSRLFAYWLNIGHTAAFSYGTRAKE